MKTLYYQIKVKRENVKLPQRNTEITTLVTVVEGTKTEEQILYRAVQKARRDGVDKDDTFTPEILEIIET